MIRLAALIVPALTLIGFVACGAVEDDPPSGNGIENGNGNGEDPENGNGNGELPENGNGNGELPENGNGNGEDPENGNGNGEDPENGNGNGELPGPGPFTETLVLSRTDDALASYLIGFGSWNIFSGTSVPVGRHWSDGHPSYYTAFRFEGVPIPPDAIIETAILSFHPTNEVDSSSRLLINVYAEATTDSAPFDPSNYDSGRPDQRARTAAFIEQWVIRCNASCTDDTEYDCPQRQRDCWNREVRYEVPKDLAELIQEVIDLGDWQSGNALSVFLFNAAGQGFGSDWTGYRSITGLDPEKGEGYAPMLEITWSR